MRKLVFGVLTGTLCLVAFGMLSSGVLASEVEPGFVSLFDGKTLAGWTGATKGYFVEDGKIVCPAKGGGNLFTVQEYSDFILRFEFKLESGSNNGLAIRAPLKGNAAFAGMELQIIDNTAEKYQRLKPWQYHGSVYGVVAAKRGSLKPVGEWNSQEVLCQGPSRESDAQRYHDRRRRSR